MKWKDIYLDTSLESEVLELLSKKLNIDSKFIINDAILDCQVQYSGERITAKLSPEAREKLASQKNGAKYVRTAIMEYAKKNGVIVVNE